MSHEDKNVERASRLDTATLSDALDRLGLVGQCERIRPRSTDFRMTGRAWTLRYGPAASPAGTVGDYIDDIEPGTVIVLDNGGREDCTVWGDILTEVAHRKGVAGTLIDGINRDVSLCLSLGYPIFSREHWMRTGKDRVQVEATQVPVNIGKVRVCPGDLIRGDADGRRRAAARARGTRARGRRADPGRRRCDPAIGARGHEPARGAQEAQLPQPADEG
jgi:4-hydroxy-4-methyl-2-oxoglutarate aldolase